MLRSALPPQPTGSVPAGSVTASLQLNHSQEDSSRCSDNSSYEEPLSPISASSSTSRRRQGERDLELRDMELPDVHGRDLPSLGHRFLPSEPSKWNVEDVYEFIRSLPGEECPGTDREGSIHAYPEVWFWEDLCPSRHVQGGIYSRITPELWFWGEIYSQRTP